MLIAQPDIFSVIPQRPPFVMIDALTDINEKGIHTSFLITDDNILVDGGRFTEAGLMENIAQTAAAGAGYKASKNGDAVLIGYIGAVKDFEVFALPAVGNTLITSVTVINNIFDVSIIWGEVTCNGSLAVKCEMKIFIKPRD